MSQQERIVRPAWTFNPHRRFDWDHPTQGMKFARTLEEAFGPGATLYQPKPLLTPTRLAYAASAVLLVATVALLIIY